jgi:hypothetical protein
MDNTLNYQALAIDIVMAAYEDAQGEGPEAIEAQQWLSRVDLETIGIEGFSNLVDATANSGENQYVRYDEWV